VRVQVAERPVSGAPAHGPQTGLSCPSLPVSSRACERSGLRDGRACGDRNRGHGRPLVG